MLQKDGLPSNLTEKAPDFISRILAAEAQVRFGCPESVRGGSLGPSEVFCTKPPLPEKKWDFGPRLLRLGNWVVSVCGH